LSARAVGGGAEPERERAPPPLAVPNGAELARTKRSGCTVPLSVRRVSHVTAPTFEQLAFEAALRALDKQERVLEELRARTGVLLAASSLAAAFLGQSAFRSPAPALFAVSALVAFTMSILMSVYVLLPNENLVFAEVGSALYEGLYAVRDDMAEVYRRLAYQLDRFWNSNDSILVKLSNAYRVAALALMVEILSLAAILTGSII
jgi:hypothetical protein